MNTNIDVGLTNDQVQNRIENGQINGNTDVKTKSIKAIIADNLFTLFNLVNFVMAFSIAMVHSYKNMMFIGVVVWNVFIGIFQEIRAKKIIDRMSILSEPKATVLRNGNEEQIDLHTIVRDDILVLHTGNQVCADSIIMMGKCLVNESMLTGESDPVTKNVGDIIYSGSFIINGNLKAQVKNIGKENYINKITEKVKYLKKDSSEMMLSIKIIIKTVSICIVPLAALLVFHQMKVSQQGITGVVINIVAAIIGTMPSGLVLLTTIVLEVAVIKLAKCNTLVQDMYCVETLARVDVLCLDKTGTITSGNMIVDNVICCENVQKNKIEEMLSAYTTTMNDRNETFDALKKHFSNDSTWKMIRTIPFSSEKKWSAVVFENKGTCIIGAAEFILGAHAEKYREIIEKYSLDGYRILTVAFSNEQITEDEKLPENIRALGFVLLHDEIRDNAKETLEFFRSQDVDIKIISGDNPMTVMHVAHNAGVSDWQKIVDCSKIKSDEELESAVESNVVFGRVTPEQKLLIVEKLKKDGHVVAMTGDGVNDVMALKEADCSIAMQSGSDAARNVSQMVLMNSDFSSLPKAVAEGRKSINNMERSATLYLAKTIYSFVLAVVFAFINVSYPFSPIQLTLIGAVAIGIPSFILAMEPNYERVYGRYIINVLRKAVPGAMGIIANVIMAVIIANEVGAGYREMSTLAAYLTAMASMVILFDLCKPFNAFRIVMFSVLTIIFLVAFRFFKPLFCVTTIKWELFIVLIAVGAITFLLHKLFLWLFDRIIVG